MMKEEDDGDGPDELEKKGTYKTTIRGEL